MTRSKAPAIFAVVAGVFAACAVIQVFLAGLGVFDGPSNFITHRNFGYMFGWLILVMLVVALVGRLPRRFVGMSVLLIVLFTLQSVFVAMRADMPQIAALHPLNGFAILAVAGMAVSAAWRFRAAPAEPGSVPDRAEAPTRADA